jgi:hypothetical protein
MQERLVQIALAAAGLALGALAAWLLCGLPGLDAILRWLGRARRP